MLSVHRPTFMTGIIVSIVLLSIIVLSLPALAISIPSVGITSSSPTYASGPVTVSYTLNGISDGNAWLYVKNSSGYTIRIVNGGAVSGSGPHYITWDGKDGSGATVPVGNYKLLVAVNRSGLEYVGQWGGKTVANPYAYGIAFNSTGYIYVSDCNNDFVNIYNSSGGYVRTFGSSGTAPGQLSFPGTPAMNSTDYVFIGDYYNKRVDVFDRNGNYVGEINQTGPGKFAGTGDAAINSTGHIYVTDFDGNNIKVFSPSWAYEYTIGTAGSGNGQFSNPNGITIDASDRVYVTDSSNNRVQIFDRSGNYVSKFGSAGSGPGQLSWPGGIAVNSTGYIYVVDQNNNRVQVFDPTWAFSYTYGSTGSGNGQFSNPFGVALNSSGFAYIADLNNNRVQVFDRSGAYISTFGAIIPENGKFYNPASVDVGPSGQVYVADTGNSRVQVFSPSGDFSFGFGSKGAGNGQFNSPYGVAVNSSGYIYTCEYGNNRVQVFDPFGNYLFQFGSAGAGNGQFSAPWGIAVNSTGYVYVADSGHGRIQVFNAAGQYLFQFNHAGMLDFVNVDGISINSTDCVYVDDITHNRIVVFGPSGNYLSEYGSSGSGDGQFNSPYDVAVNPLGYSYVADATNSRIQAFTPAGAFASKIGSFGNQGGNFSSPHAVAVGDSGLIYVADMYNNRIQVLSDYTISNVTLIVERTAPYVISTSPTAGDSHVSPGSHITVTLSEPANASTVNASTFYVYPTLSPGSHLSGTFSVSGNDITFVPDVPLTRGISYDAVVTTGVTDRAGNAMASDYTWSFMTEPIPAPAVTGISPASGPTVGGTTVTITGSGFTGATAVMFGTTPAASFIVNSDTQITAVSPVHASGAVFITVTTPGGTSATSAGSQFTYLAAVVAGLSPSSGPVAGGTTVTVLGMYFTGATAVVFDTTPVTSFTVDSDTQITAVSPAHTAGSVDVTVITADGTSALNPGDLFTYVPVPVVSSITPDRGPMAGGNTVVLTGTGFTGATMVAFGATPAASFTVVSDTQVTAVAPAGIGTVNVAVTTPGGVSIDLVPYTYVPAPAVTGIFPNSGPMAGGSTVTVTGTGFSGAMAVVFDSTPTVFTVDSDNQITAVTPAHAAGPVNVVVTTAGGSGVGSGLFTYVAPPVMTSITPAVGPMVGGSAVTLTGTGFTGATVVTFGATPATTFTVVSDTQITAVSPAGSGTVPVAVTTPGGTSNPIPFTYVPAPVLTTVTPSAGPTSGGTTVTITGTGFTGATFVAFGSNAAPSFTVNSDTQITAISPAGTGTVNVVVVTAGGASNALPFTYAPTPVISGIVPSSGPTSGGTMVTITGTGFAGATAVTFGATPASSFTVNSDTWITAVSPAGTGTVGVTVTTTGGTGATGPGNEFTYIPVPTMTTIVPSIGPASGGTSVVLTGTSFNGATAVMFGAAPASSFTVNSYTQITAVAPAGSGVVGVTVTTVGGTSNPMAYTFVAAPVVAGVDPASGPLAGGTKVAITGTGFTRAMAVNFGGIPATSFTVDSDTQVIAMSPAHAAGVVDVAVTTTGGTSAAGPADQFTYVAPVAPVADFEGDITSGVAPLTVHFSSLSTGAPTLCEWNFGDGSSNVTGDTATHTYSSAGSFTVTMTALNAYGSDTMRKVDYISVSSAPVTSYTVNLKPGWNLVSFPLLNYSIKASDLGAIGVTDVATFNNTAKVYDVYMVGVSPPEYDITLRPDRGYFVKCDRDASFTVTGDAPELRSIPLCAGWNMVGWSNFTGSDTNVVCDRFPVVLDIARYNTTTHDFDVYMGGVSTDDYIFPIHDGEGYFVRTSGDLTFPYGGY